VRNPFALLQTITKNTVESFFTTKFALMLKKLILKRNELLESLTPTWHLVGTYLAVNKLYDAGIQGNSFL
jgi:hypothetical protein